MVCHCTRDHAKACGLCCLQELYKSVVCAPTDCEGQGGCFSSAVVTAERESQKASLNSPIPPPSKEKKKATEESAYKRKGCCGCCSPQSMASDGAEVGRTQFSVRAGHWEFDMSQ